MIDIAGRDDGLGAPEPGHARTFTRWLARWFYRDIATCPLLAHRSSTLLVCSSHLVIATNGIRFGTGLLRLSALVSLFQFFVRIVP